MRTVAVDGGFEAWRAVARDLLGGGVAPGEVRFAEGAQLPLWCAAAEPVAAAPPRSGVASPRGAGDGSGTAPARVPAAFLALARRVACHRDPGRWDVLYRLLWRVTRDGAAALDDPADRDALAAARMAESVRQDVHRTHAFVRFRCVAHDRGERYVAFHRPEHRTLRLAAPFFARRFASMRWSLLTPDASAHWDGRALGYGPGAPRGLGEGDDVEALWRAYYASTFDPARVNPRLLRAHLPRRHWETLPEARESAALLRGAAPPAVEPLGPPARDPGDGPPRAPAPHRPPGGGELAPDDAERPAAPRRRLPHTRG